MDHTMTLPDEVMIGVFKHLPVLELPRCASVCQRWNRLTSDESLWFEVYLDVEKIPFKNLAKIIEHGVRELWIDGEIFGSPAGAFKPNYKSPLRLLNFGGTSIMARSMQQILLRTSELVELRIGLGPALNKRCFIGIGQNPKLEILDLGCCENMEPSWIAYVLQHCKNLKDLNVESTNLTAKTLDALISNLSANIIDLNLHAVSPHFRDHHLATIVKRCPNLKRLNIGSNRHLTTEAAKIVSKLEHLIELENEQDDENEWEDESSDDDIILDPFEMDSDDYVDEFDLDESDALEQWMMYKDARDRDDGSDIFYLMNLNRIYNPTDDYDDY